MKTAAPKIEVPLEDVDVSAFCIPTEGPESDGTLEWDSTTLVVVELRGGGCSGMGYAARRGYITACPVEKSGQAEFDFEYGEDFAHHVEAFNPTFCKVLVRYNPEGDADLNRRQAARLQRLSDYLRGSNRLFLFELLVPAEAAQLERSHGNQDAYDREQRPALTVRTLRELQEAGVEPDVWKVEGMERREDYASVVATARRDGREQVSCIVLGHGEQQGKVHEWLETAVNVPGFIGFAVGRTTFWDALVRWRANEISRATAVAEIAGRYQKWVNIFTGTRGR